MLKRFGTTIVSEPAPLETPEEAELRRWHLWLVHGPDPSVVGQTLAMSSRTAQIGRDPERGPYLRLVLPDERVSRLHASLQADESSASISDCGSSNGLFVDGCRVERAVLEAGSVIRMGDSLIVVQRGAPASGDDAGGLAMTGRSPSIAMLRSLIRRVGPTSIPVMIQGETGTGKELVARAVHHQSGRPGAFVPVNCAALPASLIESLLFGHRKGAYTGATADQDGAFVRADGGTLFLDEIGELPLDAQPKLLRVLEDGEVLPVGASRPVQVDARIVTATNVPVAEAVGSGRFRNDLFARLAGVQLTTPPLRDRREDVLALFGHFVAPTMRARPMSADFAEALLLEAWPQNVRELQKLAERLCVLYRHAESWELVMLDDRLRDRVVNRSAGDAEVAAPRATTCWRCSRASTATSRAWPPSWAAAASRSTAGWTSWALTAAPAADLTEDRDPGRALEPF
jgi:transcriptional regulator with AAA-type ATPase domain